MNRQLKSLSLLALLVSATMLTGCVQPPLRQGPPPARVEVIPVAPSPRHVWIPGHYVLRGRNYIWVNGFYQAAPARRVAWVPGFWQQTRRGQAWVEGHWR